MRGATGRGDAYYDQASASKIECRNEVRQELGNEAPPEPSLPCARGVAESARVGRCGLVNGGGSRQLSGERSSLRREACLIFLILPIRVAQLLQRSRSLPSRMGCREEMDVMGYLYARHVVAQGLDCSCRSIHSMERRVCGCQGFLTRQFSVSFSSEEEWLL